MTSEVHAENASAGSQDEGMSARQRNVKLTGFLGGIVLAIIVGSVMPEHLTHEARMTAAVGVLMGAWWVTEAIPLPATALMPIVLFPALGISDLADFSGSYAGETIFLFLGGFLLALAIQRWNLHRRIALRIVLLVGTSPTRLIAGFMIATALLSMWVSNTATAMIMLPMGLSVLTLVEQRKIIVPKSKFGIGLMLAIAYSATIGGFQTIIGTPVNVFAAGYLRDSFGYQVTFFQWFMIGFPLTLVFLIIGWILICKVIWRPEVDDLPGGREMFQEQYASLGKMRNGELAVAVIFACTAVAWMSVSLIFDDPWATDAVIAMIAGLACFLLPARPSRGVMLLNWKSASGVPWGMLILFGGGLALSSQITGTGLAEWMGESASTLGGLPPWVLVLVIVIGLNVLTEFTSSVGTAATFLPILGGIAGAIGQDPVIITIAGAIAISCTFMFPVGTPPNAIVFGTGAVTLPQMMRTGLWFNLVGIVLVTVVALVLVPAVIGT